MNWHLQQTAWANFKIKLQYSPRWHVCSHREQITRTTKHNKRRAISILPNSHHCVPLWPRSIGYRATPHIPQRPVSLWTLPMEWWRIYQMDFSSNINFVVVLCTGNSGQHTCPCSRFLLITNLVSPIAEWGVELRNPWLKFITLVFTSPAISIALCRSMWEGCSFLMLHV